MADQKPTTRGRPPRGRPVVGPYLRKLLVPVLGLFGLLAVNGVYLASITLFEWASEATYQDYFYQVMFLVHLVLGLLIIVPVVVFGAGHLRNAWSRPNRPAVRAGLALYTTALLVVVSGVVLIRFDFFEIKDPEIRAVAYWVHVAAPLLAAWLFVLHRLAGSRIRWKVGATWAAVAVALPLAMLLVQRPDAGGDPLLAGVTGDAPFAPSLSRTASGGLIPARALMMDQYCLQCHADVHEQWSHSAHRFSSFNNPAYRFSVREVRDLDPAAARFCAGCHDLVPLFSGVLDDPGFDDVHDPTATVGITCSGCHAISRVNSPRGNGDYTIEEPVHYPFAYSDNAVLQWVNRQLVKAKPAFHEKVFMKPVHREAEFCSVCHKVFLPEEVNRYKWLRGQNHYDAYILSGVSGHGATSFYYPPRAVHRCAQCHMPLQASADFGADFFDGSGELKVHNHQFPAANTALPHLLGLPEEVNDAHRSFLAGSLRVDIFGIKEGGTITGPLTAPLGPRVPALVPGERYLLETVLRTVRLGHVFTQGTADSNQVWLDVRVTSGEALVGRSGGLGAQGEVDPWSHFVNAYVLDREGNRIDRRNGQDIFTTLYNHQIPPGAADVVHYAFTVPAHVRAPVTVEVSLNYRKFDTPYMRHFQGRQFVTNDLPVTVIARDRITFPLRGSAGPASAQDTAVPAWERWNDYGIALLRKGERGELRQAEQAFARVEELGRADGPLNLARVYLREGRLDDAAAALRRAAAHEPPAPPWVVAWLTARINKQNGYLDEAIQDLKRIVATGFADARAREFDFSRDYRVLNELGQTLVERAKQERGSRRRQQREQLLREAAQTFQRVLVLDPENVTAHYNLALVHTWLGDTERAGRHRSLHGKYRADDNARERVVTLHRRRNPAADHAAEAVVIYDLQRPGAFGLSGKPLDLALLGGAQAGEP
ncbi:MAG: multiheme c-type cytochrome [Gammaproteobacteria bacterium]|nr:multiheme c-type cytochrome [Gammaproteobacteria bacterium]